MATTTTTITEAAVTPTVETIDRTPVYGCLHIEHILQKHGERVRQEYDSVMAVVNQPLSSKAGRVKVCQDCRDPVRKTLMCLTCAYVGCTRKGHIFRHFKENKAHRISVASDSGNVFCHECDDYIYDPTLESIQRSKRMILGKRKREAETVPNANGNDESTSSQSSTSTLTINPQTCKIAGLRGIQNLGNTCYMSTILQSLVHNPIVRNHYLSDSHKANLCTRQNCVHCTINTVFANMYSSTRTDPASAFGPTDFITTVWKIGNTFAGTDQQDSHEFLMFLLNCMHTHHLPEDMSTKISDEKGCKCLAHQVFGGESQSQITCNGCGKVNRNVELMFDIGLQIRGKPKIVLNMNNNGKKNGSVKDSPTSPSSSAGSSDLDGSTGQTLQDCLDKYTSAENSQYTCSSCSTSAGAIKQMSIKILPNVLCLQFKRFDGRQAKIDQHVRFPTTLDMSPYTTHAIQKETADKRDCTYDLFAVVVHIGANIHKGHYVNYAKFNGEWFSFNDHIVEWVTEESVLRQKAYLCFYIKHCLEYEYDETLKRKDS